MRLIDADALSERKFIGVATWTPTEATSWQRGWNDAIQTIMECQPTVDAVSLEDYMAMESTVNKLTQALANSEKHGHWTDRAKSIIGAPTEACSVCAEWSIGYKKDYCPNCGAIMDEVEDE